DPWRRVRRPAPLAALGALAVVGGGIWSAGSADGQDTTTAAREPTAPVWTAHPQTAMRAVLVLPPGYEEQAREGGTGGRPRFVVYRADDGIRVRLA
ncbi:serine/threonine protein kinase, partial [Streptomyces pilosus]